MFSPSPCGGGVDEGLVQRRLTPQDSSAKPGDEYWRIVLSGGDHSQLGVRSFVPGLVGLDLHAVVLEEQLVDSGLRGVVADQVGAVMIGSSSGASVPGTAHITLTGSRS